MMKTKLTKITDTRESDGITERFNKDFEVLLNDSNKELDKVNKYLQELYLEEVKKDGATKTMLDKVTKLIKQGLVIANKTLSKVRGRDYEIYTFTVDGVPGMLLLSDIAPVFTKAIDHSTVRTSGIGISAVFSNDTRLPVRVEFNGVAYPVLLSKKELIAALDKENDLDEALLHEIGYIKKVLDTPNTFKGYSSLSKIGDMYYDKEKAINNEMKCSKLNKTLEDMVRNATEDDRLSLIMGGINLIGINTLAEAKILGDIIKRDPDKSMRIKVLKKLFNQA